MGCCLGLRALKTLYFYFCKVIKKLKINWKDFFKDFCKKLWKNNNTWNIRLLVDGSFVPSTQHIILKIVGFQKSHSVLTTQLIAKTVPKRARKTFMIIGLLISSLHKLEMSINLRPSRFLCPDPNVLYW